MKEITLPELIEAIRVIHHGESPACQSAGDFLTDGEEHKLPEIIRMILDGADQLLISGSQADFKQIRAVELALPGVSIRAGEQDCFGWLTGVIHTDCGQMMYG